MSHPTMHPMDTPCPLPDHGDLHPAGFCCGSERPKHPGEYCKRPAGTGTEHPGVGSCKFHLGTTRNHGTAARERMAHLALLRLGRPAQTADPAEELLAMVREAVGNVACLRDLVGELGEPAAGADRAMYGPDHLGDLRLHPLLPLYETWCTLAVKYSAEAVKAGLADRLVKVEEQRTELIARAMMAFMDDPELGLSRDQREIGRRLVGRHLRALGTETAA